jgi:hypothetical protein
MVRQKVAITTSVTRVVGPYQCRRISGTSAHVDEVVIATLYDFGDFSVYVTDIRARLDHETGSHYLSGPVALRLNNKVNEIIEEVRRKQQDEPDIAQGDTPLTFELKAPDFLTDAA